MVEGFFHSHLAKSQAIYLLADAEQPHFQTDTHPGLRPSGKVPSLPPKGAAFRGWEGLSEKNQHISNLFFRPDRKLSFQIQTALKIILARHEYQLLPLHLMICPRRPRAAHDPASAYLPAKSETDPENLRSN